MVMGVLFGVGLLERIMSIETKDPECVCMEQTLRLLCSNTYHFTPKNAFGKWLRCSLQSTEINFRLDSVSR